MEKLAKNDLTYFYLRHVVIVVTAVTTISLTPLNNNDKISNKFGRSLVQLCGTNDMCIINGRKTGDNDGEFTYLCPSGVSVILTMSFQATTCLIGFQILMCFPSIYQSICQFRAVLKFQ